MFGFLKPTPMSRLHDEVRGNDLAGVQRMVEREHVDIEASGILGMTALLWACEKGHMSIVRYLVEKRGANIAARAFDGSNAFHFACAGGHLDIVEYFVESLRWDKVNAAAIDGSTGLHCACKQGQRAVAQYLVERCQANVDAVDTSGNTALHHASRNGNLAIVQLLLESGQANIHTKNSSNDTALDIATAKDFTNVATYIRNWRDHGGPARSSTPSSAVTVRSPASSNAHAAAATAGSNFSPLVKAILNHNSPLVRDLVERQNANVNEIGQGGCSPLHYALMIGNLESALYLATRGANVHARTDHDWTVLHIVSFNGPRTAKVLEQAGFKFKAPTNEDVIKVVRCFVETCRVNEKAHDDGGMNAFHAACMGGCLAAVRYYVEKRGFDVNSAALSDEDPYTPLHCASVTGSLDVVRYLVEVCDADIHVTVGRDKWTAWDMARFGHHPDVCNYLQRRM